MIDRVTLGPLPDKPHTVFRDPKGKLLYEEMFTRGGFSGAFSYFYHLNPVMPHREVEASGKGFSIAIPEESASSPLERRLYISDKLVPGTTPFESRTPLLTNADVSIYLVRAKKTDDAYFANGDGDELWFIQEGDAQLESPCGMLDVKAGDYVWLPKSLVHRWHVKGAELRAMIFEAHGGVHVPEQFRNPVGQLQMDAPYTHRDFVRPNKPICTFDGPLAGPSEMFVKKRNRFTRYVLENPPMDVVGWEGFVYPWAFAIEKFQPKTGLVHLPPTIHATFAARGFLLCSFVPRMTDTHPNAIPCPYPHSSVDCDEMILYLKGNFTSRKGVGPGAISLHPAGIAHGPHPGAYEGSIGSKRTDELAVMIDSYLPLLPTKQAKAIEDERYHASWTKKE